MLSTQQIFWSIAIVSSVLLVILLVMTLFDTEDEDKKNKANTSGTPAWLDARLILLFTTLFGWFAVIGFYLGLSLPENVLIPALAAFLLSFAPMLTGYLKRRPSFDFLPDLKGAILTTGQVLKPIPPHRNGFGTVQLDHRQKHLEIDAVTTGQEIQPGAPVRVVDIIDNRILVVEPLPGDLPPDGGMRRENE